ncbi:Zinc/RING finger protein 4 [Thelohanellus kitauei]|uniref:Zinc/RING finger protein 4 n=1 Tax=Thelohanellus kitauei TaxID=669202 RepID=A0A0C2I6M7_THEKT|nr:Zinc/RING finger protein 4 [Thelohanellus kitauei]
MILLLVLLFKLTHQKISVIQSNRIIDTFDEYSTIDYFETDYSIQTRFINAQNRCDIVKSFSEFPYKMSPFIFVIRESNDCGLLSHISIGLRFHLNVLIYAVNPTTFKKNKDKLAILSQEYGSNIIFIHPSHAIKLSEYYKKNDTLLKIDIHVTPNFIVHFIGTVAIILFIYSIVGVVAFYLFRYLLSWYRGVRARWNVMTLPSTTLARVVKLNSNPEDDICVICLNQYTLDDKITILNCNHNYHQACISLWKSQFCPICRRTMYINENSKKFTQTLKYFLRL